MKLISGRLFIDIKKFVNDLNDIFKIELTRQQLKRVDVWCKNSSFFNEVAVTRGTSDIDYLTIVGDIPKEKKRIIYFKIIDLLRKYSFSTELPHQLPIFTKGLIIQNLSPIVRSGKVVFSPHIPDNLKNLEKYKARVKIKTICGEISVQESESLKKQYLNSHLFGEEFVEEMAQLRAKSRKFPKYQKFIRKIESLLSNIGSRDGSVKVILNIDEQEDPEVVETVSDLMAFGIVYLRGNLLYINWDLRRPQHNWAIPIYVQFKERKTYHSIEKKSLNQPLYARGIFKKLKLLRNHRLSLNEMFDSLASDSFLITSEAFISLSEIKNSAFHKVTEDQKKEYFLTDNSNCEDGLDKKLNLLGLISPKLFAIPDSKQDKLSKYNLFVFALHNLDKLFLDKTDFFHVPSNGDGQLMNKIVSDFKNSITRLLREYYIYSFISNSFLLNEKKKEILFAYFVRGRSLMEGPLEQQQQIKNFLKEIPIKEIFVSRDYLERVLTKLSDYRTRPNAGEYLPQYLIRSAINQEFVALKNDNLPHLIPKSKISLATEVLNKVGWQHWKRSSEYKNLFSYGHFRGAFLLTFDKKYPAFYFDSHAGHPFIVLNKSIKDKIRFRKYFSLGKYIILSVPEFLLSYRRTFQETPPISLNFYRELKLGERIRFGASLLEVTDIIGEGNYSVIYKAQDKRGKYFALKHSLLLLADEVTTGKKLHLLSHLFTDYMNFEPYHNYGLSELLTGKTLTETGTGLNEKQLREIFKICLMAYKNDVSYGDTTPNNTFITQQGSLRLIDPCFFYPPNTAFLKDILGIFYLIYFSKYQKRPSGYWPIRLKIILSQISSTEELFREIENREKDKYSIRLLRKLNSQFTK